MAIDVEQVLESVTLADRSTIEALYAVHDDADGLADALSAVLKRLDNDDVDHLIPLLSAASSHVLDAELFAEMLEHRDRTVRLVAAKAAAARGERRGLATLVDLLEDTGRDRSSRAPVPVWAGATLALARLTGQILGPPLDADAYTRRRARERWHELLQSPGLTWSVERGEWD